jgi:hypothetical protein
MEAEKYLDMPLKIATMLDALSHPAREIVNHINTLIK